MSKNKPTGPHIMLKRNIENFGTPENGNTRGKGEFVNF